MAEVRQRRKPGTAEKHGEDSTTPITPAQAARPEWTWSNYDSWPLSVRYAPAYFALFCCAAAMYYFKFIADVDLDMTNVEACISTFNYTFRINAARHQVEQLSTHSWEIGTAVEAITELMNPETAVFAANPFPNDKVPRQKLFRFDPGLAWAYQKINRLRPTLFDDDFSVTNPASLGVATLMFGQRYQHFLEAAERQKDYLFNEAPKYINGAISYRGVVAELWSNAISMFPPFLAYYAVQTKDTVLMKQAFRQIQLYRDVLSINRGPLEGLWMHIKGPSEMVDEGTWSTGNAWAAYGMARVRATISGWTQSNGTMAKEISQLDQWIGEILDGAIRTDNDESGLLRNYLGDNSWFGETSGTALLAAAAYRMAVLRPEKFGADRYISWAHTKRQAVFDRVDDDGFVKPAINPLKYYLKKPAESSPEGESFLVILGAAWRDCVCAGICSSTY